RQPRSDIACASPPVARLYKSVTLGSTPAGKGPKGAASGALALGAGPGGADFFATLGPSGALFPLCASLFSAPPWVFAGGKGLAAPSLACEFRDVPTASPEEEAVVAAGGPPAGLLDAVSVTAKAYSWGSMLRLRAC